MHKSISDSLHTPIKNKQGPFQSDTEVKKNKEVHRQAKPAAGLTVALSFFLIAVLVQSRTPHYCCVVLQRKGFCWPTAVAPAGMPT